MEKLKVKHNHTLTDILKVCLFALFLILPILMFLPSCVYYAFNEHAVINTTEQTTEITKTYKFNQLIKNGLPTNSEGYENYSDGTVTLVTATNNNRIRWTGTTSNDMDIAYEGSLDVDVPFKTYDIIYYRFTVGAGNITTGQSARCNLNIYTGGDNYTIGNTSIPGISSTKTVKKGIFIISEQNVEDTGLICEFTNTNTNFTTFEISRFQLINLTYMYGRGNEPDIETFQEEYFSNSNQYYDYTTNTEITKVVGTETEIVESATNNISEEWKNLWNTPVLKWTDTNNFAFTINAVSIVFGITQESYIANYLTYILTLMVIYIIFDIVIVMFTKLTHIFNE